MVPFRSVPFRSVPFRSVPFLLLSASLMASCSDVGGPVPTIPDTTNPDLTYTLTRYFAGLGKWGKVRKDPWRISVELEDGTIQPLSSIKRADVLALRSRNGALTPELAQFVAVTTDEFVEVGVEFLPILDPTTQTRAAVGNASERRDAARELNGALTLQASSFVTHLKTLGLRDAQALPGSPIVVGRIARNQLSGVAQDPRVLTVFGAASQRGIETSDTDPVPITQAASIAWSESVYGAGRSVGNIGVTASAITHEHSVFARNSVTYTAAPANPCFTSLDCAQYYSTLTCVLGQCRSPHETEVIGIMAQIAPQLHVFHATDGDQVQDPNGTSFWTVGGSLAATNRAYNAFLNTPVRIVNESYGINDHGGGPGKSRIHGIVEDERARVGDFLITQSAGNRRTSPDEEACPHTLNSICVGGVTSSLAKSCFSSWRNPGSFWGWQSGTDREEPDVMALGGEWTISSGSQCNNVVLEKINVPDATSTTAYKGDAGTSLASPAAAAMIALAQEYCETRFNQTFSNLAWRAIARNATWDANPTGWKYSTLNSVSGDHEDGGGLLTLGALVNVCHPPTGGGPTTQRVGKVINLNDPGDPPPVGGLPPGNGFGPPPGGQSLHTRNSTPPNPGTDRRKYVRLTSFVGLPEGTRLRATLTWNSCLVTSGVAPGEIGVDFDLFLWHDGPTNPRPYYGSQTIDDNNEGFDVTLQKGDGGDLSVWVAFPDTATGCAGGGGMEPIEAVATVWY